MVARLRASQIPPELLRELKGLPKRKRAKETKRSDIPESWLQCMKPGHGWAASGGSCPYCEEGDLYVQLDEDYFGHPKTLQLVNLLGQEADVYPPRLWTWAMKYAKDGKMRNHAMIETACRWKGEPGELAQAMIGAGFVDFVDNVLSIHNWMRRTGHDIEVYEAKKKRLRERRAGNVPGMFPEESRNVPPKRSGADLSGAELIGAERKEGVLPATTLALLLKLAHKAPVIGRLDTIRQYVEGWIARTNAGKVEQVLMDPWTRGKTVIEIQDRFFGKDAEGGSWKELLEGGGK